MLNKLTKYVFPMLAVAFGIFALLHALAMQKPEPEGHPPVSPSLSPFGNTVAGVGMIESNSEASGTSVISIGSQLAGAVDKIYVRMQQEVKEGDLLFELDKRQMEAQVKVSQANLEAAQAQLRKLELQPRKEEIPPLEAQIEAAVANVKSTKDQMERDKAIPPSTAIAEQQRVADLQAYNNAVALLGVAKANLALLKAGAWAPDIKIAQTSVAQAQAQLDQAKTNLALLQVRAPSDGTILQLNIRAGEYVSTMGSQSLILMGNLKPLHVRVSIDEEDLPRLILNAPATAKIRGDIKQQNIPLRFVRLEPYVVPKVSLTGINTERVDTRVVQLIYAIETDPKRPIDGKMLVGQIVDVFIDTKKVSE
ncbi:efflux RND transporter periplasmic adaptor subunit [Telmatocola sphagniphila]|uniref:Efflux RND transporter periplasmic adaptor subunit n=1 Tax=Telmatocola sphagniphila TaxID=1123043 RepID=A0A8E6ESN1_9BACT|nr:biotin/lipoyl-binding protein [Telmatocola sphagniphila]QVL31024.1 efflux RND transporter periplasmic adaptor subunit [Telmatocola sphagniphila]